MTVSSAKSLALDMLSRRNLSARELEDRLKRRGQDSDEISQALADLTRLGLIDDRRLAEQIITAGLSHNEGPSRIQARMASRGVPGPVRRELYHEVLAGNDWQKIALRVRERYDMTNAKDRARFIRHLAREGFPAHVVREVADSAMDFVDDSGDEPQPR